MVCKLCEVNEVEGWFYNNTWCKSCRKIKHYLGRGEIHVSLLDEGGGPII